MFWISIRYKSYSIIKPHKQSNIPSSKKAEHIIAFNQSIQLSVRKIQFKNANSVLLLHVLQDDLGRNMYRYVPEEYYCEQLSIK